MNEEGKIKLKTAVDLFKQEEGAPSNSYDWYRRSAKNKGEIYFGEVKVSAFKYKGIWHINYEEFNKAIKEFQKKIQKRKK